LLPRFVTSHLKKVRPIIPISKYRNFLTGILGLLELVPTQLHGHNI
jgi:hypothetical protein